MRRMVLQEDIKPLAEFSATVESCIQQVRKTKRPVLITEGGTSAAVLLDAMEYEDLLQRMELLEEVTVAEEQLAAGHGLTHEAALAHVMEHLLQ